MSNGKTPTPGGIFLYLFAALVLAILMAGAIAVCNYGERLKIKNPQQQEDKGIVPKGSN